MVLEAWTVVVGAPLQDSVLDEVVESLGQDLARYPEVVLDVFEAVHPDVHVAQNQG